MQNPKNRKRSKLKKFMNDALVRLVVFACSFTYAIPTLLPFLIYVNRSGPHADNAHLYLVLVPYSSYWLLELVKDRQGFNLPYAFLVCGATPGSILLLCAGWPPLNIYLTYGIILSMIVTVLIWTFFPNGRLRLM